MKLPVCSHVVASSPLHFPLVPRSNNSTPRTAADDRARMQHTKKIETRGACRDDVDVQLRRNKATVECVLHGSALNDGVIARARFISARRRASQLTQSLRLCRHHPRYNHQIIAVRVVSIGRPATGRVLPRVFAVCRGVGWSSFSLFLRSPDVDHGRLTGVQGSRGSASKTKSYSPL